MALANVLLLRAPSAELPDPYEDQFVKADFLPFSLAVLETVFVNLDALARILRESPDTRGCDGVILTSARGAEGLRAAMRLALQSEKLLAWCALPFYVVGDATAAVLVAVDSDQDHPIPSDIRGAGSTGTSEKLARLIVSELASRPTDGRPPRFLYLTGDKNRDTLRTILAEGGVELDTIQAYATQISSTFAGDLDALLRRAASSPELTGPWWIVFFAPSSATFALPHLSVHFDLSRLEHSSPQRGPEGGGHGPLPVPYVAAIGPTTATALTGELHLVVWAISVKPKPENLLEAILHHSA